ncbi:DUF58 domain-containing protein [Hamadaea tsunoensis]|uniref:DUF58 domain-containing protein n=1 Tax=Hamadaea tsunoensis TaxID=53368 RepID=UPI00041901E1|nr:DUF58 domain-containing protein [Hamadaea tsunoensis]
MITWKPALLFAAGLLTVWWLPWPWLALLILIGLVALVSLGDLIATPSPAALTLSRSGAKVVRLGEDAVVDLLVHNPTPYAYKLRVRDAWVPSAGQAAYAETVELEPGATVTLPARLHPTRRGDRPAVRVTLRAYGPWSFAFKQVRHARADAMTPQWTLRVLPRFDSRRHLPEKLSKLRTVEGATAIRGRGQGTEFDALREYVVGDDVRSIDWRATARRNDVVVRTWRPERSRRVVCVLDSGRTSAVRVGDVPRLDHAIDAALLLAAVAEKAGDQVDLIVADERVRATVTRTAGRALLTRLVDALAPVHPATAETDFELIASEILRTERKRSLVVLFTALEPGALGEGLLPVLPRLAARHTVLVAAVHDPIIGELIETPPTDASAVYRRVAGLRAREDRSLVVRSLSRHGVRVLDAAADRFASEVTDVYLDLKATGRL